MRVKRYKVVGKSVALAALLIAGASAQANLVQNGGFETGDFTGWDSSGVNFSNDAVDVLAPHDGTYAAYFGSASPSVLKQTLTTEAGKTYALSFWLQNEFYLGVKPNAFELDWNGTKVDSFVDADVFGYTEFSYLLFATGASTELSFSFVQPNGFLDLDSVNVELPEPGSFALAGLAGMLALGVSSRRRKPGTT